MVDPLYSVLKQLMIVPKCQGVIFDNEFITKDDHHKEFTMEFTNCSM